MKYISLLCIIVFAFNSCKRDSVENSTAIADYTYFPLNKGSWIIYNVDSIIHLPDDDATDHPDTSIASFHFQIKEVIDSSFIDGEGNTAFRVSRYDRLNDTLPWNFRVVWLSELTFNSAQRVEDNIRYVKLAFPFSNVPWNGNAYNNLGDEDYSYTDMHSSATIGSCYFDSVVTVLQLQDDNLIHEIFKQEKYANRVGLVYMQKDSLNINGIGQVTNGIEFRETIQSYGN